MPGAKGGARVRSLVPSLTVNDSSVASSEAGEAVAVTVAVSVPRRIPLVPPRPVTVRVKVSSVSSGSDVTVTFGVTLVSSSNVTATPLAGLVSAHP